MVAGQAKSYPNQRNNVQMFDERPLKSAMAELGYKRLKRYVYSADWSTSDVEHFMYYSLYGTPKDFITADFGVRNKEAEIFAIGAIKRYGGDLYQLLRYDEKSDTFMRFSLGTLASWGLRSSIKISSMTGDALAKKIQTDIREKLLPIIGAVRTLRDLLSFLLIDEEPRPWVRCNGAIRAAEIAHLAVRVGLDPAEICKLLNPYHNWIKTNLADTSDSNPESYIKRVVDDAVSKHLHQDHQANTAPEI
jgi:hypothetical protein